MVFDVRKVFSGVAFVSSALFLHGCKKHDEDPQHQHDGHDGTEELLQHKNYPHLGETKIFKCCPEITDKDCIHVEFAGTYHAIMQQMYNYDPKHAPAAAVPTAEQNKAMAESREEFRQVFLAAVKELGEEDVSIEFMPVNGRTQNVAKLTYRVFLISGLANPKVDLNAWRSPRYHKVHEQDNPPNKVEVFPSCGQGCAHLVVPAMQGGLTDNQKQSFRSLNAFLVDETLKEYHQEFLAAFALKFHDQMTNTYHANKRTLGDLTAADVFTGAPVYICTEGSTAAVHWLHLRFDHDSIGIKFPNKISSLHQRGVERVEEEGGKKYLYYYSMDWKKKDKPEDFVDFKDLHADVLDIANSPGIQSLANKPVHLTLHPGENPEGWQLGFHHEIDNHLGIGERFDGKTFEQHQAEHAAANGNTASNTGSNTNPDSSTTPQAVETHAVATDTTPAAAAASVPEHSGSVLQQSHVHDVGINRHSEHSRVSVGETNEMF